MTSTPPMRGPSPPPPLPDGLYPEDADIADQTPTATTYSGIPNHPPDSPTPPPRQPSPGRHQHPGSAPATVSTGPPSPPLNSYPPGQYQNGTPTQQSYEAGKRNSVVIKVGMVGDAQIGKTSLMVKYVEGSFDEDYIQTLGMSPYPPPFFYVHN